jgi:hypothetical protein
MAAPPLKPDHRRLALYDQRLLPSPKGRMRTGRRSVRRPDAAEDGRLFAGTLRTANASLRALLPDEAQLRRSGLPLWRDEADLARALGLSVRELRFWSIHRRDDRVWHYVQFTIPKASGGQRLILAPKKRLKAIQRRLVELLVSKLPVSEYAHAYRAGHSVRTMAEPHVGRRVLVQLDLKDFFPTITFGRVRGLLVALGYGYAVAATLAALMTEAERQPVEVDGVVHHVPIGPRHTVQGAPTSPGLSNSLLRRLDRRLAGLARHFGFTYTRYADDLTFSGDDADSAHGLRKQAIRIIEAEGFTVNGRKTRTARAGRRQRVTGVVVNEVLGLSRQERRLLRAEIHRLARQARTGPIDESHLRRVQGRLAYLAMLNPAQAEALRRWLPEG